MTKLLEQTVVQATGVRRSSASQGSAGAGAGRRRARRGRGGAQPPIRRGPREGVARRQRSQGDGGGVHPRGVERGAGGGGGRVRVRRSSRRCGVSGGGGATAGRWRIRDAEDGADRWKEACEAKETSSADPGRFRPGQEAARAAQRAPRSSRSRSVERRTKRGPRRLKTGEERPTRTPCRSPRSWRKSAGPPRRLRTRAGVSSERRNPGRASGGRLSSRDRDLRELRGRLEDAERAARMADDAARELDEVKRQATEAAEKGGARIRDLESRAEALAFEMDRRDGELGSMREALEEALRPRPPPRTSRSD